MKNNYQYNIFYKNAKVLVNKYYLLLKVNLKRKIKKVINVLKITNEINFKFSKQNIQNDVLINNIYDMNLIVPSNNYNE